MYLTPQELVDDIHGALDDRHVDVAVELLREGDSMLDKSDRDALWKRVRQVNNETQRQRRNEAVRSHRLASRLAPTALSA